MMLADLTETQREEFQRVCQRHSVEARARVDRRDMLSVAVGLRSVLPPDHPLLAIPLLPNWGWNQGLMLYLIGVCRATNDLNRPHDQS